MKCFFTDIFMHLGVFQIRLLSLVTLILMSKYLVSVCEGCLMSKQQQQQPIHSPIIFSLLKCWSQYLLIYILNRFLLQDMQKSQKRLPKNCTLCKWGNCWTNVAQLRGSPNLLLKPRGNQFSFVHNLVLVLQQITLIHLTPRRTLKICPGLTDLL